MNDIYYRCHNCGSVHESEHVRQNLYYEGRAVGDAWAAESVGALRLGRLLARRRTTRALMRGLWPG